MAATKISTHSRSISLPTRAHPLTANVEEHLWRLRSSKETSTSSLSGLKDLYECVNDFLQLPATQQKLSTCLEDVLCGSVRLLDLCSTTKDAVSQMRTSVQDLESSLRRREADASTKVKSYLICKKNINQMVFKCLSSLKKSNKSKINETCTTVSLLREVEEVSITIFESLFASICPGKTTYKQNSWSLVAKLTQSKRLTCEGGTKEELHTALEALYKQKSNKNTNALRDQEVQKCLKELDMNMEQLEEDLDFLSRSLIKTRVSLLNVLNH